MKLQIQATNLELTDAIRSYVEKRMQSVEKLIDPNDTSALCQVEVEKTTNHHKSGEIFRSEINLHIAGADFRATEEREQLYDAIDETKNQMMKELRRHKGKRTKERRRGGARIKEILRGFTNR